MDRRLIHLTHLSLAPKDDSEPSLLAPLPPFARRENDDDFFVESPTDASPDEVWKRTSQRLLDHKGTLTGKEAYTLSECIQWWARRRKGFDRMDPTSGKKVWLLWKKLVESDSSHHEFLSTELLNIVLDHWRLCVKQNINVGDLTPNEVILHLENLPVVISNVKSYTILLSAMAYAKDVVDPERAELILDNLPTHVTPTVVLWNAALTLWAKCDALRWPSAHLRAEKLFQRLCNDYEPDEVSYTCLLEALANHGSKDVGMPRKAEAIHQEMTAKELISPIASLQLMRAWVNSELDEGADKAHAILRNMVNEYLLNPETIKKPNNHCFSVVMEGFARQGKPDRVEQMLLQLQDLYQKSNNDLDLIPTATTFNSVLSAYTRCSIPDRAERAEKLLMNVHELAESSGVHSCRPDTTSVNTVINAWAESNQNSVAPERAEALLRLTKEWPGVEPDSFSYTSVMKAWARSDRPQSAKRCESYLAAMWSENEDGNTRVCPTSTTYATVIYAWSRSKNREAPVHAESVFHEMEERFKSGWDSLKPTEATYMTLMTVWNRSGLPEARSRVQYYFSQIRERYLSGDDSLVPSARVYNAMLLQLKKSGDGQAAENLLDLMASDYDRGNKSAQPNTRTFNTALSAWANSERKDRTSRAETLLLKMLDLHEERGWDCKPSDVTYSCLLDCWAKSNSSEAGPRAESILRHMERLGVENPRLRPTSHAFATVINAWTRSDHAEAPERAQRLLDDMQNSYEGGDYSLRPSGPAYSSVITCWARCGREDGPVKALEVLRTMEKRIAQDARSEAPNRMHYSATINAFASSGDVDGAEKLLEEMLERSIDPHYGCFNAVLKAIAKSGVKHAPVRAERVFSQMKRLAKGGVECQPSTATYTTMLDILRQHPGDDTVPRAHALLKEMMELASKKGGSAAIPNTGTFTVYLRVLSSNRVPDRYGRATETLEFMRAFGCKPTPAFLRELESLT